MRMRLHIERVILEGRSLTFAQRETLRAELQNELSQLLTQPSASSPLITQLRDGHAGGAIPSLTLIAPAVRLDSPPATLGRQIASSLHGGLTR